MKLSANPRSEHYREELIGNVRVLLDGVESDHVDFADEENGFVVRAKHDEQGEIVVQNDFIVWEKISGEVRIIDTRMA